MNAVGVALAWLLFLARIAIMGPIMLYGAGHILLLSGEQFGELLQHPVALGVATYFGLIAVFFWEMMHSDQVTL